MVLAAGTVEFKGSKRFKVTSKAWRSAGQGVKWSPKEMDEVTVRTKRTS